MKIRFKIDCVIEAPHAFVPLKVDPLDVIEAATRKVGATEIYPGGKLSMKVVGKRDSVETTSLRGRKKGT